MRRFAPRPEPPGFDTRVRARGNRWLARNPNAKPKDFPKHWKQFRKEVEDAFEGCCAYLGFPITSGQVDHFVAKGVDRTLTYEWSNYRWSEDRVNKLKGNRRFLDPFAVQPGWVIIDPVSLEYAAGPALPPSLHHEAEETLRVLNDPGLVRGRRRMLHCLRQADGNWDVPKLRLFFPLLAEAAEAFERAHQASGGADTPSAEAPTGV